MNIRDVHGVSSQQELYELATVDHGLHVSTVDKLIAFVVEIQSRALTSLTPEKPALHDEVVEVDEMEGSSCD